jgi:hypothetical protein
MARATNLRSKIMDNISESKLYELVLAAKQHQEERRGEINKFYISLFTGVLALVPLVEKFVQGTRPIY